MMTIEDIKQYEILERKKKRQRDLDHKLAASSKALARVLYWSNQEEKKKNIEIIKRDINTWERNIK